MAGPETLRSSAAVSLRSLAYNRIREGILSLELRPGEPLSENRLAGALKISRTPVREALKQLEKDGLVRFAPPKGAFVTDLPSEQIAEIYQVREALEGLATRLAAEQMPESAVMALEKQLDERFDQIEDDAHRDTYYDDRDLHEQIIRAAGNRQLAQFLGLLNDQMYRIWHLSPLEPGRVRVTLEEHRAIITALKVRDGDAAESFMKQHLRTARERALRLVASARLNPFSTPVQGAVSVDAALTWNAPK